MMIDIFAHIMPIKYKDAMLKAAPPDFYLKKSIIDACPMIYDLDLRFKEMEKHGDYKQILSIAQPPVETLFTPKVAIELAKIGNEGLAEIVAKNPDRFAGAVACLPVNDIDATLREIDHCIKDLKFKGIQLFTPANQAPLDGPEFMLIYDKMAKYDLPIWIHPKRTLDQPDYLTETKSKYVISNLFGWVYETTAFMTRIIFSGTFEKYPNIKFVTHHAGAMVPMLVGRITDFYDKYTAMKEPWTVGLKKEPIEYFKMFYVDTAINAYTPGLMCAYAFYGAEKMVFATDMPLGDREGGFRNSTRIIKSVQDMTITKKEKDAIFSGNAKKLMKLA